MAFVWGIDGKNIYEKYSICLNGVWGIDGKNIYEKYSICLTGKSDSSWPLLYICEHWLKLDHFEANGLIWGENFTPMVTEINARLMPDGHN